MLLALLIISSFKVSKEHCYDKYSRLNSILISESSLQLAELTLRDSSSSHAFIRVGMAKYSASLHISTRNSYDPPFGITKNLVCKYAKIKARCLQLQAYT